MPKRKVGDAEVRVVVEVNGQPVGFMSLDMERLWPLINHRIKEIPPAEWIDFSHRLIWHGRRVCIARRPRCHACVLADACPSARPAEAAEAERVKLEAAARVAGRRPARAQSAASRSR